MKKKQKKQQPKIQRRIAKLHLETRIIFNGFVMVAVFLGAAILLAIIEIDNPSWLHSLTTVVAILFSLISSLIIFLPTFLNMAVHIERQTANTSQANDKAV